MPIVEEITGYAGKEKSAARFNARLLGMAQAPPITRYQVANLIIKPNLRPTARILSPYRSRDRNNLQDGAQRSIADPPPRHNFSL